MMSTQRGAPAVGTIGGRRASHHHAPRGHLSMNLEHPSWCSPTECLGIAPADRFHLSRPALAHSRCGDLTISVQIAQLGHDAPAITMVVTYADDGPDHPAEECPI